MIGLGVDMVQISQLQSQLADDASVFAKQTFTNQEIRYSRSHASGEPARHLAARFAAKEALIKAWSSLRVGKAPVIERSNLREIEVHNDPYGRPQIRLHGLFKEHLNNYKIQVSLSHDGDYAIATILLFSGGLP